MKPVQAIICDVYKTILDVREAPADAEGRWEALCAAALGTPPVFPLKALETRCRAIILEDHTEARRRGIAYPEVHWPSVMKRALPALDALSSDQLDAFIFQHAQLSRTLRIMPGSGEVLRECHRRGICLGIASNAQAYTLEELRLVLGESALNSGIFAPDLTFWSFQHGFSKPDPHVFAILRARLENRCITGSETLMIGDRRDNDIQPARAAGWRTWQLCEASDHATRGDWKSLARVFLK